MNDSGIGWIGEYPSSWKLERLQWHLFEINEKNNPIKTTNVLSLTNKKGVIPYEEKGYQGNNSKENYNEYKIAYKNTIIVNSMNVLIGSVGYSNYTGCVSPVYYVFKEKQNNDLRFLNYIFQTLGFQRELRKYANGILEIRLRVSSNDILKRLVVIPPFNEQNAIADFLDKKCFEIDALIRDIESQISLLKKYRIQFLDDTLKSSQKIKLGYIGVFQNGSNFSTSELANNVPFLGVGDFKDKIVISSLDDLSLVPISSYVSPSSYLKNEDIVFVRSNGSKDLVGRSILIKNLKSKVTFSGFCIRFRKNTNEFISKFLVYYFQSNTFRNEINKESMGTNINNLSQDVLRNVYVPYVAFEEQKRIVSLIEKKIMNIDEIIDLKNKQINVLFEYKKSLIYEYVTGKKVVK